jgi:hypothetical protein
MITKRAKENKQKDNRPDRWFGRSRRRILSYPDASILARAFVVGVLVGVLLGAGAVSAGVAEGDVSFDKSFENSTYTVETSPGDLDVSVSVGDDGVSIEPEEFGTTNVFVETGIGLNETTDLSTSVNLQMFPSSTNSEVYVGAFDEDFSVGSQTDRAKWGIAAKSASGESLVEIYEWGANSSEIVEEQKIGEYVNPPERVDLSIDFGENRTLIQSDDGVIDANVSSPQFSYLAETTGIRASLEASSKKLTETSTFDVADASNLIYETEYINETNDVALLIDGDIYIYDQNGTKVKEITGSVGYISLSYSETNNELVASGDSGTVSVFDMEYSEINSLDESNKVWVDHAPNGYLGVTWENGGGGSNVRLYDSSKNSQGTASTGSYNEDIAISNDSLYVGVDSGDVEIFDYSLSNTGSLSTTDAKHLSVSESGYVTASSLGSSDMDIYDSSGSKVSTISGINGRSDHGFIGNDRISVGKSGGWYLYDKNGSLNSSYSVGKSIVSSGSTGDGYIAVGNNSDSTVYIFDWMNLSGESLRLGGLSGGFGGMGSIFPVAGLPGSARAQMVGFAVILGLIVWGWRD